MEPFRVNPERANAKLLRLTSIYRYRGGPIKTLALGGPYVCGALESRLVPTPRSPTPHICDSVAIRGVVHMPRLAFNWGYMSCSQGRSPRCTLHRCYYECFPLPFPFIAVIRFLARLVDWVAVCISIYACTNVLLPSRTSAGLPPTQLLVTLWEGAKHAHSN